MTTSRIDVPNRAFAFDLGWTEDAIKAYIESKPLVVGDVMIVANGQAGFYEYELVAVENPCLGRQRRVVLKTASAYGGASFYRTGRNCFAPRSQSRMLPPTELLAQYLLKTGDRVEIKQRYGIGAPTSKRVAA